MSPVPLLLVRANVSESEPGETFLPWRPCVDNSNRQKNSPTENPDRDEDLNHHAQIPHEEVRVEAIVSYDLAKIGVDDSDGPEERGDEGASSPFGFGSKR